MMYANNHPGTLNRSTVQKPLSITGKGLHSGKDVTLRIFPADPGAGLVFRASGSQVGNIPVNPFHVVDTRQAVTLGNSNWRISTVEHLLCGLAVAGITDAYFEIDAPEIPILDGSALPFYEAIMECGVADLGVSLEPITLKSPIWVVEGDRYIIALPDDSFRATYSISFDHPMLRGQSFSMELNSETCLNELISARTFGFIKDMEVLQSRGLALGASLDNAVVLSDDGYLNDELRFENECIRHKVLDLIGDLYLIGRPLKAHIIASKAGHTLDVALGKNILATLTMDELAERRQDSAPAEVERELQTTL